MCVNPFITFPAKIPNGGTFKIVKGIRKGNFVSFPCEQH